MVSDFLKQALAEMNIDISKESYEKFEKYYALLIDWNEKMNLTAITEPQQVAVKHFADSLTILKHLEIEKNAKVIDIGTGAGFPGIPLKIVRDDLDLTLLDSLNKRLVFLQNVCDELNITAKTIHSRAEEASRNKNYREVYDYAFSRAVAQLNLLCELCLPYVKKGGFFAAMKGPDAQSEIANAENAVELLGGKIKEIKEFSLPDNSGRTLVIIEKIKPTPEKYPRHGSKIKSKPL